MFQNLTDAGFDVVIRNHAQAIFQVDFPEEAAELVDALLAMRIPAEDLVASGGGEAASTRWLRRRLYDAGWRKHNFVFRSYVDGQELQSISHEIDHIRRAEDGVIALEIEWNNKDPFFDRDLENFQRLHAQGAVSMGVIVTRGSSMQTNMRDMIRRCVVKHGVRDESGLLAAFDMKERTARQRAAVESLMARGEPFAEAFARHFTSDKFGPSTTHWGKLEDRIHRGVGNPCPLVLIGLPDTIVDP